MRRAAPFADRFCSGLISAALLVAVVGIPWVSVVAIRRRRAVAIAPIGEPPPTRRARVMCCAPTDRPASPVPQPALAERLSRIGSRHSHVPVHAAEIRSPDPPPSGRCRHLSGRLRPRDAYARRAPRRRGSARRVVSAPWPQPDRRINPRGAAEDCDAGFAPMGKQQLLYRPGARGGHMHPAESSRADRAT